MVFLKIGTRCVHVCTAKGVEKLIGFLDIIGLKVIVK